MDTEEKENSGLTTNIAGLKADHASPKPIHASPKPSHAGSKPSHAGSKPSHAGLKPSLDLASEDPLVLKDFLNFMVTIKGKSMNTLQAYAYDLRLFFRFLKIHRGLVVLADDSDAAFSGIDISDTNAEMLSYVDLSELYAFLSFVSRDRANHAHARARKAACLKSFTTIWFPRTNCWKTTQPANWIRQKSSNGFLGF